MNRRTYKQIRRRWRGPIYQDPGRPKMRHVHAAMSELSGASVVDLGCNGGILSYDLAVIGGARRVIGVEHDARYYAQALVTAEFMPVPCAFYHMSVGKFVRDVDETYDAAFASCVLYHLTEGEIVDLEKILLPRCTRVVFVSREDKKPKRNKRGLHRAVAIHTWLQQCGFDVETRGQSNWRSVIGRRIATGTL